jgi:hypothetical protein
MYNELLERLQTALLRRNPGIASALQPGRPADTIRQELKRAHVKGNIEPIVELYSWHDGARFMKENDAYRLGFAPPTVTSLPRERIEQAQQLGYKIDPNAKVYGRFEFSSLSYLIWHQKHWRKWAPKFPRYGGLVGRVLPFLQHGSQMLGLDIDPSDGTRVLAVDVSNAKSDKAPPPLRTAYASFEEFLLDAIRANETNELLRWPQNPGEPIDLPPAPAVIKASAKPKAAMLPASERVLAVRTDFADDAVWESLQTILAKSLDGDAPALEFASDSTFSGLTAKQLPKRISDGYAHSFAIIIDQMSLTETDHSILIVDLLEKPGRSFRAAPTSLAEVLDNLTTANMDFGEFAAAARRGGVFRGFE